LQVFLLGSLNSTRPAASAAATRHALKERLAEEKIDMRAGKIFGLA
jgi:hypothetical protein